MATRANETKRSNSQALVARIDEQLTIFEKAHKESHESLAILSRELLIYVCGYGDVEPSGDIGRVNRLLKAIDPVDRKRAGTHARDIAIAFFVDMLDYTFNAATRQFEGGKIKSFGTQTKIKDKRTAFLRNPTNTIWTWAEKELAPVQRAPMNYVSRIESTLENALDEDKNKRWFKGFTENGKVVEEPRDKATLEDTIVNQVIKVIGINRFMDIVDDKRKAYSEALDELNKKTNLTENPSTKTPAGAKGKQTPVKV